VKIDFEGRVWEFDPNVVDVQQGIAIWLAHGLTLLDWEEGMERADPRALQCTYWLMLAQNGTVKAIKDCNFAVGPFSVALQAAQEAEAAANAPAVEPEPVPTQPGGTAASPELSSPTDTTPPPGG
jgi:hypothetical protein